ncbi:hypothetical protein [Pseudorhodoferax sp. Leaf267]|uniref:hypothetical protein n=1 Tax=Pseudorhodoferax sp. Leaf267 TaxID=1736316 RepID=UPI0006FC9E7D|nr:hypothetical protein [Pseudorhodoferax sp. Leaf267]
MLLRTLCLLAAVSALLGCGTSAEIMRIRSLAGPAVDPADSSAISGRFEGIDRLAQSGLTGDVALLFVHGIGFTQLGVDAAGRPHQVGIDLAQAIASAYGHRDGGVKPLWQCPHTSDRDVTPHLAIRPGRVESLSADDPKRTIGSGEIGCIDRITVPRPGGGHVYVYRLFWDKTLWDAFEWPFVGYDDNWYNDPEERRDSPPLRAADNSRLKRMVVTYGLTDAAAYMGRLGRLMREAVEAASCAVIAEHTGAATRFAELDAAVGDGGTARSDQHVTAAQACTGSGAGDRSIAFGLVTHSLGSRVAFDVFTQDMTPALNSMLQRTANTTVEIYMLANQIPLIGVGRVAPETERATVVRNRALRIVAVSEINDLLTYELVPYFEHLYAYRCHSVFPAVGCNGDGEVEALRRKKLLASEDKIRNDLVEELGFDVVDVRVRFAPNFKGVFTPDFKDPEAAHADHMRHRAVVDALLCGVENGRTRPTPPCRPK